MKNNKVPLISKIGPTILAGGGVIFFAWLSYWIRFGHGFNFSVDPAVWGQFGDFLGGVINPLLTFISVILLINSVGLQRQANNSLIELEDFRKTEQKFYNMLESQRGSFEGFKIKVNENPHSEVLFNGEAVLHLEEKVLQDISNGASIEEIRESIENLDKSDAIYNVVRRFYLLVSLILKEVAPEKRKEYFDACVGMTDYRLICLLVMSLEIFDWSILEDIDNSGILADKNLADYRESFSVN
ncbi:hypothetical protein [Pantoea coffeiphila]|uniref:Phage abortive infection protein n=1 Tax=Pantoea coffeiphila TaxID=1465635 RepID=A0A2S9IAT5_9GAMM|nr:hypothetical protein [Pantoea coffeiphila]PRD14888.1 hypothetical protein CQW29_13075 [Pantoea coffeiphila]